MSDKKKILVVDNYDSFTWNLVHYLEEIGASTRERTSGRCAHTLGTTSDDDSLVLKFHWRSLPQIHDSSAPGMQAE